MKYRTYKNMVKATEIIKDKGYEHDEANQIAIQCFDRMDQAKNGMSIEWYLDKIANKSA